MGVHPGLAAGGRGGAGPAQGSAQRSEPGARGTQSLSSEAAPSWEATAGASSHGCSPGCVVPPVHIPAKGLRAQSWSRDAGCLFQIVGHLNFTLVAEELELEPLP